MGSFQLARNQNSKEKAGKKKLKLKVSQMKDVFISLFNLAIITFLDEKPGKEKKIDYQYDEGKILCGAVQNAFHR